MIPTNGVSASEETPELAIMTIDGGAPAFPMFRFDDGYDDYEDDDFEDEDDFEDSDDDLDEDDDFDDDFEDEEEE